MIIYGRFLQLFVFACIFESLNSAVQLRRKTLENGVAFTRVQNYTNLTLPYASRSKTEKELAIDILMMADYSLYQGFLEISRGDESSAQVYVQEYLAALFDQMTTIYDNIEIAKQKLLLSMAGTFVTIREEDCPMLSEFDDPYGLDWNTTSNSTHQSFEEYNSTDLTLSIPALQAINKLTVWVKNYLPYLPKHDHAVLITKFDLLSARGDSSTQGMAYVGEICRLGESSSVVEDIGAAATALIAAHELGHSLGSFHDGSSNGSVECSSSDNYLMATTVSGSENDLLFANSRLMSQCSQNSIEKRFRMPTAQCVWKDKIPDRRLRASQLTLDKKPGERFPLHQQCQIIFGPHYGICPSKEYLRGLSVCRRIWCKNRTERRSAPCETRTYLPALDGTECAWNKWCIGGECVPNTKKLMECRDLNAKTCSKYSKVKLRHYCKSKDFRDICCYSCMNVKELVKN